MFRVRHTRSHVSEVVEDRHHSVLNIHLASILIKFLDRDDVVSKPWDVVHSGEYAMFSCETVEEDRTLPANLHI